MVAWQFLPASSSATGIATKVIHCGWIMVVSNVLSSMFHNFSYFLAYLRNFFVCLLLQVFNNFLLTFHTAKRICLCSFSMFEVRRHFWGWRWSPLCRLLSLEVINFFHPAVNHLEAERQKKRVQTTCVVVAWKKRIKKLLNRIDRCFSLRRKQLNLAAAN